MTTFAQPHRAIQIIAITALFLAAGARAEKIHLRNGEILHGTINHYYNGLLNVTLKDGSTRTLGRNEVGQIEFEGAGPVAKPTEKKPPAPSDIPQENFLNTIAKSSSPFATPLATFDTWRRAAVEGKTKEMIKCYASFRQKEIKNQLKKLSRTEKEKMQSATAATQFIPGEPFYQGDRALLEVRWNKGFHTDTQVLQFVLEKNEWKIIQ